MAPIHALNTLQILIIIFVYGVHSLHRCYLSQVYPVSVFAPLSMASLFITTASNISRFEPAFGRR